MGINPSQLNLQALGRDAYRLTPATLAMKTSQGSWIPAKHLTYISSIVASRIAQGGARLTISIPPRHGKSEFCSIHTPIWVLENYAHQNIILASYGADLSTDFSRRVRDTFQDEDLHGVLNTRLKSDSTQVARFHTNQGGAMFAMGISGALTGRGAHLLLVDDYLKNAEESLSAATRDKIFETFRSTVYTRLEPGASVIIVATRWHQEDLIGKIHKEWPGRWEHIELPALAREGDPLGREVGEPLWPERYDEKALLEIKEVLGTYWWEALYQQNPMASMNTVDLASKLRVVGEEDLPHYSRLRYVRAWDFAGTEGSGDWTVGFLLSVDKTSGMWFIHDITRFQKSAGGKEAMLRQIAGDDGRDVPIIIEQEPGSSGKSYIEYIQREVLPGFSVTGEHPTGPIQVRASPLLAAIEADKVRLIKGAWNEDFIYEVMAFPNGDHDDQVSAGALGHKKLDKGRFGSAVWGRGRGRSGPSTGERQYANRKRGYKTGVIW